MFSDVKTDSPNFYKHFTRFWWSKKTRKTIRLIRALRCSKQIFRSSTNLLPTLRRSIPTLLISTSVVHALQMSKRNFRTPTEPTTRSTEVKTDPPNFYKPCTCFSVAKKDSPNFYMPLTRFTVFKTDSSNFYKPPTRFVDIKTDSPNSY